MVANRSFFMMFRTLHLLSYISMDMERHGKQRQFHERMYDWPHTFLELLYIPSGKIRVSLLFICHEHMERNHILWIKFLDLIMENQILECIQIYIILFENRQVFHWLWRHFQMYNFLVWIIWNSYSIWIQITYQVFRKKSLLFNSKVRSQLLIFYLLPEEIDIKMEMEMITII